jgi:hypothetical protein
MVEPNSVNLQKKNPIIGLLSESGSVQIERVIY